MKQYIGIIRDHSGSMMHIANSAMKDYNDQIEALKSEAKARDIDTIVSVVKVGQRGEGWRAPEFRRDVVNSSVSQLKRLHTYPTPGGSTPLFDGLNDLIDLLEGVPDKNSKDVAFLILVITDGQNNVNDGIGRELGKRIQKLQGTDHWTFTFRVPRGHAYSLAQRLGIPRGNIMEWEQTEQGFERATHQTIGATQAYYSARTMGATASQSFYANPGDLSISRVKKELDDITEKVSVFITSDKTETIRPFIEKKTKKLYIPGTAFYKLVKPEASVQSYKQVVIRDRKTLKFYGGDEARDLLGLPSVGAVRLKPGNLGQYDVFVQSNSVNRKLVPWTEVVYWPKGAR